MNLMCFFCIALYVGFSSVEADNDDDFGNNLENDVDIFKELKAWNINVNFTYPTPPFFPEIPKINWDDLKYKEYNIPIPEYNVPIPKYNTVGYSNETRRIKLMIKLGGFIVAVVLAGIVYACKKLRKTEVECAEERRIPYATLSSNSPQEPSSNSQEDLVRINVVRIIPKDNSSTTASNPACAPKSPKIGSIIIVSKKKPDSEV